ncbi:MAG: LpqB family beta-propeller domain-containing protein [Candidatus Omnitrophica bacterium]|nr:LpqB family beta-propeller domain-containing protein [Candidatus Omnitrophota bacterium]
MRKTTIFLFFCLINFVSIAYSRVFLQITGNPAEKMSTEIIIQGYNKYSNVFTSVLKQDLSYSDAFNVISAETRLSVNYENIFKKLPENVQILIAGKIGQDINVQIYNTAESKYITQLTFTPVISNPVRMAHIVSDAIVEHLTGFPGIAQTKIVYISKNSGKNTIHVCDYDGRNDRTVFAPDFLVNFPRWMPDNKIIYLSYRTGFPFLETMNLITDRTKTVLAQPGINAEPSVFHHDKKMAVVLSKTGNSEIYIVGFNGKIIRRITDFSSAVVASPAVSPNGKRIIFVLNRQGATKLWMLDTYGFGLKQLPVHGYYLTSPSWSPNGNYLAYVIGTSDGMAIQIYDFKTGYIKSLTNSFSWSESPSWAPDSRHIVFTRRNKNYRDSLWIVDIYTGDLRMLKKNADEPCWSN